MRKPLIVGLGGTPNPLSTTERAVRLALREAEADGARTLIFDGAYLSRLPLYLAPGHRDAAAEMIAAVREADGVILGSPGYHGSLSGVLKNAVDYLELTARDPRTYLDGVPVGLVVTAAGWQATGSTLAAMRSIVHALRGWPTPLGVAINTSDVAIDDDGRTDPAIAAQLAVMGRQVSRFARLAIRDHALSETV